MPELPEVETIVRELRPMLTGNRFKDVSILWGRTVSGDQGEFIKTLTNSKISRIDRRGKYLCFFLEAGPCMTIHLRMTGNLVFEPSERDKQYIRVAFAFNDGSYLYFVDIRKFGRIQLWPAGEPLLPQLGPEPLDQKTVLAVLKKLGSRRAIKTVLLDQGVLAGAGNIYADEALFMSGIHPLTPALKLSLARRRKLSHHLPLILEAAIKNNGTTISDYRRTDRLQGENQFYLNVYGRKGEPCVTCKTAIIRISINNRSSHFCPKCQRGKYHLS